jgi:hypothetical protein
VTRPKQKGWKGGLEGIHFAAFIIFIFLRPRPRQPYSTSRGNTLQMNIKLNQSTERTISTARCPKFAFESRSNIKSSIFRIGRSNDLTITSGKVEGKELAYFLTNLSSSSKFLLAAKFGDVLLDFGEGDDPFRRRLTSWKQLYSSLYVSPCLSTIADEKEGHGRRHLRTNNMDFSTTVLTLLGPELIAVTDCYTSTLITVPNDAAVEVTA